MYGKSLDVNGYFQKKILGGQDGFWEAVPISMHQLLPFKSLK